MAEPTLTRFDFHVYRFLNSDDVENMTAEEVGQYLLLLCYSFVKGKEASLPDDPGVLARYARVDKVSKLVMKKFPIVETEWGARRRNETLYGEYLLTKKRSENGRNAVAQRWENDGNTPVIPPYNDRSNGSSSKVNTSVLPIPYHTSPNQSTPHQASEHASSGNWKTLAIQFRRVLGKFISSTKTNKQRYAEFCGQYSEDQILSAFEAWGAQNKHWLAEKNDPLHFFWSELPTLVESLTSETEQKKKDGPEIPEAAVAAAMSSSVSERQQRVTEELNELIKAEKWAQEHREEI